MNELRVKAIVRDVYNEGRIRGLRVGVTVGLLLGAVVGAILRGLAL